MTSISFIGAKGGSGTSTIAAATALLASEHLNVCLEGEVGDMAALLGIQPSLGGMQVNPTLRLNGYTSASYEPQLHVWDLGPIDTSSAEDVVYRGDTYIVMRGPDYLGLRRVVEGLHKVENPKGIVLLAEKGRALSVSDVEAATHLSVVFAKPISERVARDIDAGLFAYGAIREFDQLRGLYPAAREPERAEMELER